MTRFDNEGTFRASLFTGINMFLGAGFSILAHSVNGEPLLLGAALAKKLRDHFKIMGNLDLVQVSTILEHTKRQEFYEFLRGLYSVGRYDQRYKELIKLNVKSYFTTNIDDLIINVYKDTSHKYLNDVTHDGTRVNEPASIDYSALHGCVCYPDRKLIFDVSSLTNAYSNSPRVWNFLSQSVERYPTLFWGYGLNDTGVIQSLTSGSTRKTSHKPKWIILTEDSSDSFQFFETLGFNIIASDTAQFLDFLGSLKLGEPRGSLTKKTEEVGYYFQQNLVPSSNQGLSVTPISRFFMGDSPTWSNVYSGQIYKTHHYHKIIDLIHWKRNTIVLGGPVTGKTTLMMLCAADSNITANKLVFDNLSERNANLIVEVFKNEPVIVFVDNLSSSLEAFVKLASIPSILLIGFDRTHSYGVISHFINEESFEFLNVTELSDQDVQGIYDELPMDQRCSKLFRTVDPAYQRDSIFEFVTKNVLYPKIESRYADALNEIESNDPLLAEFLILVSYVHSCNIPVSFDMLCSYFYDDIESFEEVYTMRVDLADLVKEYSGNLVVGDAQDYFYPRSIFSAETILKVANRRVTKTVIDKMLDNVPSTQIPYYSTFRRQAYDKNLIGRIFDDWREGQEFYEKAYNYDFKNPYVLQQGALYLSNKKRYTEAFHWIDRALTQSKDKQFSIRNSHAIILFEANINSKEESVKIRLELDKSMKILEKCYRDDKRRMFHAIRYADQTKEYAKRYFDEVTRHYVTTSIEWLKTELHQNSWNNELRRLLKEISDISI